MCSYTHVCIGYAQLYVGVSIYAHFLGFFFTPLNGLFTAEKMSQGVILYTVTGFALKTVHLYVFFFLF